nr:147_t:CDS:2 [Entrophospora candida]
MVQEKEAELGKELNAPISPADWTKAATSDKISSSIESSDSEEAKGSKR